MGGMSANTAIRRRESQLNEKETANDTEFEGASVYVCPSCGAELVTSDTTAATMCYYCHNPVILTGRLSAEWKPDCVIPFSVDRDTAKAELYHWLKKKRYVPKDFAVEKNLDTITGVYYPYWLADYSMYARFTGEGIRVSHTSTPSHDITTRRYYNVVGGLIAFGNVGVRASRRDRSSQRRSPIRLHKARSVQGFVSLRLYGGEARH